MNSLINPPTLSDDQSEHLQEILGGFGDDYKKLCKKGIIYPAVREYILPHKYIIEQFPNDMFMLNIMCTCVDYHRECNEINQYMRYNNISSIPKDLYTRIDEYLIDHNIPITHPARYTKYRKIIALREIELLNTIIEKTHKSNLNKRINSITKSKIITPIPNVPHSTNINHTKKERTMNQHNNGQRPSNSTTITEIRERLSTVNPNFIDIKATNLMDIIKSHGVTRINDTPIHGTHSGRCTLFYNLDEANAFISSTYAKYYKPRNITKREKNRKKNNSKGAVIPLKYINDRLAKINKSVTRESLEKKGIYAVTHMIDSTGMCWLYSKTEADAYIQEQLELNTNSKTVENPKVTELITSLNTTLTKVTEEIAQLSKVLSK